MIVLIGKPGEYSISTGPIIVPSSGMVYTMWPQDARDLMSHGFEIMQGELPVEPVEEGALSDAETEELLGLTPASPVVSAPVEQTAEEETETPATTVTLDVNPPATETETPVTPAPRRRRSAKAKQSEE